MARRLRIPFLLDAALVSDEAEMARLNNEPAIRRGLSGGGPLLHRLLRKKIHATFGVGDRLLPTLEPRDDAARARAQEDTEKWLTGKLEANEPFERASVAALAQYVAGARPAVPIGVAVQQLVGRLFFPSYTATPETYKAACVVNSVLSLCPITMLRVLWWKLTGRLGKSRTLLWALAQENPGAIHATAIAMHNVVDSVTRMRAIMRADGPWQAKPAQAAEEALVAPRMLLRERVGGADSRCPFRPGTLVLFRLQAIHKGTESNDLALSRKEWSQCPAHAVVPRLLEDVWQAAVRTRATQRYRTRRSLVSRLFLGPAIWVFTALNRRVPWYRLENWLGRWLGKWLGFTNLAVLRAALRQRNLYDTSLLPSRAPGPLPAVSPDVLRWRTPDGSFNDLQDPAMGRADTRFGRNVPLGYTYPPDQNGLLDPNPRLVSNELLTRRGDFVEVRTLNMLAAGWIQFQVHDWFSHGHPDPNAHIDIALPPGDLWPGPTPMRIGRTQPDTTRADDPPVGPPTYINKVTHWWDASQLYGSDPATQRRVRSGRDGKLTLDTHRRVRPDRDGDPALEETGRIRRDAHGIEITGFTDNWWLGLSLFHHLFSLEHNAICDSLKDVYSDWDDERLFQTARLINAALIVKIHEVDWTPTILRHPAARKGLDVSWWGLLGQWVATHIGRFHAWDMLGGTPGSATHHHGAPYAMTEEFVSVYRMHALMMPDDFQFYRLERPQGSERRLLSEILGADAGKAIDDFGMTNLLYSFGRTRPGALTLGNYPSALQQFRMPHDGTLIDLATVDIVRDRERGVPRYNQFRQLLQLPPVRTFEELNPEWADKLRGVYGTVDGIDLVDRIDLMVGLFAEEKPRGFGFGDTTFRIFLLMNGRRLKSDRFFTADYRPAVYTQLGLDWIDDNDLRSVLLRHHPELGPALAGVREIFGPWVHPEPDMMPPRRLASGIAAFGRLVGLLKYGLVLSALLVYLPLTTDPRVPLHALSGNLFSELSPFGAFWAAVFVFLAAWTVMIVEGLIVNGVELRFPASRTPRAYRRFDEIRGEAPGILPQWADKLFSVPVTRGQFALFTLALAGPAAGAIVLGAREGERLWALAAVALAFVVAYTLLLLAAAPAAVLDPDDAPLQGQWPGAHALWGWLRPTWFRTFAEGARSYCSSLAYWARMRYVLDKNRQIYPAHLFAVMAILGFFLLWIATGWLFHPSWLTAAAIVYVYVTLLMFVWFFGALTFHLARLHISPLVAVAIVLVVGYAALDHRYRPAEPPAAPARSVSAIEVAVPAQDNLVVVAAAGGGAWGAGWTARGLEQLLSNRPELRREIRVLSAVSGGAVGAAFVIDGLLRDGPGTPLTTTLHDARVRSTASSLQAVTYGMTFGDFPLLITGGLYSPGKDRGQRLEEEWARIAAAPVTGENVGRRPEPKAGQRPLRSLNTYIREGSIPAPIFGTTVMETGQRLMITPVTFAPSVRVPTLHEFLFDTTPDTTQGLDVDLWTAARLSATFSYISPPVRSWLNESLAQRQHLIDGGYYDNFGVTSALDWLVPVLEARKADDSGLRFKRVLVIELSGFPERAPESFKPADGLSATFTGPLTALLALREGVATSRNRIDLDRFKRRWNEALKGQVQVETVKFRPDASQAAGPLSWHLSSIEIERLKTQWGPGTNPDGWQSDLWNEWVVLDGFLRGTRPPR